MKSINTLLDDLEEKIGYSFDNRDILLLSLVHRSYGNENEKYRNINNERLELLGDSILGFIVTEALYLQFPNAKEGELAKVRSNLINQSTLASFASSINLGSFLLMGKGEEKIGGRERQTVLGDSFEALLGGLHLDGSYDIAQKFCMKFIGPIIADLDLSKMEDDHKTKIQKYFQSKYKSLPQYSLREIVDKDGLKVFEAEVIFNGTSLGKGLGKNKKDATQNGAKDALANLEKRGFKS